MKKVYDTSDFGLCMNAAVRMFRRSKDMDLFRTINSFFHTYISSIDSTTVSCALRDLQPESMEGDSFTEETWHTVLPLHDFLLTVLISRKLKENSTNPKEWIMSGVMIDSECIGGRFANQAEFDSWSRRQDFSLKHPYLESNSFDISDEDIEGFNLLLLSMLTYSAPRATYMPDASANLISVNLDLVNEETRKKMTEVIEETAEHFEELGKNIGEWDGMDPSLLRLKERLQ